MRFTLGSVLAFATSALAITVTSPAMNAQWDLTKDNKITWTSVSTDPSTVNIILVNMSVNPSVSQTIATNIAVSDGSYDLKNLKSSATPGGTYQINLQNPIVQNPNQPEAILAQSGQFTVEKFASTSTSSAESSSSSASASKSSASASSASASASSASSSASAASASASSASSSASASTSSSSTSNSSSSSSASASSTSSSTASGSAASSSHTGAATMAGPKEMTGLGALLMGAMMVFA